MAEPHAHSQPIQTYGRAAHNRLRNAWPILLFALVPPVYPLLVCLVRPARSKRLHSTEHTRRPTLYYSMESAPFRVAQHSTASFRLHSTEPTRRPTLSTKYDEDYYEIGIATPCNKFK